MKFRDGVLLFLIVFAASACARFAPWWLIPVPIAVGMAVQLFWLGRQPVTVGRVLTIAGVAVLATAVLGYR
jgi:hypothetical protein